MLWEEFPSEFEQDVAYRYCMFRSLNRPNVSYFKIISKWILFTLVIAMLAYVVQFLLNTGFCQSFFSNALNRSERGYHEVSYLMVLLYVEIACWLFALRWFITDCIKLYQRYAPEEVRRRCLLMPTCSEFAILALRKYGLILGLYLTYIRVFKRCRGNIYRIEYPCLKH